MNTDSFKESDFFLIKKKRNPPHSIQSRLHLIILHGFVTFILFNTVKHRIKAQKPPF